MIATVLLLFILVKYLSDFKNKSVDGRNSTKNIQIFSYDAFTAIIKKNQGHLLSNIIDNPYCSIKQCKTVICLKIINDMNTNKIVSDFINDIYKIRCTEKSIELIIENCKFPSNKLQNNWLQTEIDVEALTIKSCFLDNIEYNAFNSIVFNRTISFSLIDNNISILKKSLFHGLKNLKQLSIINNWINQAEFNLLESLENDLEVLVLKKCIKNEKVLRNITGGNTLMLLQLLLLQNNYIFSINNITFKGIPNIKSLYIDHSHIFTISPGTFEIMAKSLEQLFINDNRITTLPNKIFDTILQYNKTFRIYMKNNPWHCECNLYWLKKLIQKNPNIFDDIPICCTPKHNTQKSMLNALFCDERVSTFTSVTSLNNEKNNICFSQLTSTTEIISEDQNKIQLSCVTKKYLIKKQLNILVTDLSSIYYNYPRKLLSSFYYEILPKHPNFSLIKLNEGLINVTLPKTNSNFILIWFPNNIIQRNISIREIEKNVCCIRNLKHSFLLQNLNENTVYTICLLNETEELPSPLNCLAFVTSPSFKERVWLTNGDKILTFSIFFLAMITLCIISTLIMYIIIRRYPSLLCGSKRIVFVKHRKINAIILPEGIKHISNTLDTNNRVIGCSKYSSYKNLQVFSKNLNECDYITPLPPVKNITRKTSKTSKTSLDSSGISYISGIEPTVIQLASWRLNRLENEVKHKDPPPVPAYPSRISPISRTPSDSINDVFLDAHDNLSSEYKP